MEAKREFVTLDTGASTSQLFGDQRKNNDKRLVHSMPSIFDTTKPIEKKVMPLKEFLEIILGFLKDDEDLA